MLYAFDIVFMAAHEPGSSSDYSPIHYYASVCWRGATLSTQILINYGFPLNISRRCAYGKETWCGRARVNQHYEKYEKTLNYWMQQTNFCNVNDTTDIVHHFPQKFTSEHKKSNVLLGVRNKIIQLYMLSKYITTINQYFFYFQCKQQNTHKLLNI